MVKAILEVISSDIFWPSESRGSLEQCAGCSSDVKSVTLNGEFDGLVLFAAPDVYASPQALAHLLPHVKDHAPVVAFKPNSPGVASREPLNLFFQSPMKVSFRSTPNHEPWCVLENRVVEVHVQEYFFGSMFLTSGGKKALGRN